MAVWLSNSRWVTVRDHAPWALSPVMNNESVTVKKSLQGSSHSLAISAMHLMRWSSQYRTPRAPTYVMYPLAREQGSRRSSRFSSVMVMHLRSMALALALALALAGSWRQKSMTLWRTRISCRSSKRRSQSRDSPTGPSWPVFSCIVAPRRHAAVVLLTGG